MAATTPEEQAAINEQLKGGSEEFTYGSGYQGTPVVAPGGTAAPKGNTATKTAAPTTPAPNTQAAQPVPVSPTGVISPATSTTSPQYPYNPNNTGSDAGYAEAQSLLAPTAPPSESDLYTSFWNQSQPVLDAINQAEAAAEAAANNASGKESSGAAYDLAREGGAGGTAAASSAASIENDRQTAIATALSTKATALGSLSQTIQSAAQTQANYEQENAQTLSSAYIAQKQTDMNNSLAGIAAQGTTLDEFQQQYPQAYSNLLQYAGGDPNALNALFVTASKANLINSGQPISTSGNTLTYGYQGLDASGNPTIKTTQVTIPTLPNGYKVSSYNQAADGTVTYLAFPVDAQGNQTVDPSKPNNGIISGVINSTGATSGATIGGMTLGTVPPGVTTDEAMTGQAIMDGSQPPPTSSGASGNSKTNLGVKAYLAANGFDLSTASLDWTAMNKYVSSLNSTQQIRLRQAAVAVPDMLTNVQSLYNDTYSKLSSAGITELNSANLSLAAQGVYGEDAQASAVQLQQQIIDITSDLATIYKGGNAATDQSLQTGAEQLSGSWDPATFTAAIQNINANIGYRINAINQAGVGGTGSDNIYASDVGDTSDSDTSGGSSTGSGGIYDF